MPKTISDELAEVLNAHRDKRLAVRPDANVVQWQPVEDEQESPEESSETP
jgi:hypothetical protein